MARKIIIVLLAALLMAAAIGCTETKKQSAQPKKKEAPAAKKPDAGKPKDSRKIVKATIENFAFQSAEIKAGVNDIIDWENKDSAEHSVHADDDSWKSDPLAQGQHFEQSFSQPGTYTYHCHVHPTMKGTIVVE